MFDRIKKVTDTIDSKRPKVLDRLGGPKESKGPKPKIRSEHSFTAWNYYFTCDICGAEYGPKSTRLPEKDNGVKIWQSHYMYCPDCKRFVCKPRCWNYNVGKCLFCAPSREIEKSRMRPNIREERKLPGFQYIFTCATCDRDFGPEKSMTRQMDYGFNITQKYFRQCPSCGRYICRTHCWNYEKGTCTLCNALNPPNHIVKNDKIKKEYYFICDVCRDQFGPISEVDWERVLTIVTGATKIALNVICQRAREAVSGAFEIAEGLRAPSLRKAIREVAADAKADLAQCPDCKRWVCIDKCWDKTTGVCNNCSKESMVQ